jgi:hypothetical protein
LRYFRKATSVFLLSLSVFCAAEIASSPFVSLGPPGNDKFFVGAQHAAPARSEMAEVIRARFNRQDML